MAKKIQLTFGNETITICTINKKAVKYMSTLQTNAVKEGVIQEISEVAKLVKLAVKQSAKLNKRLMYMVPSDQCLRWCKELPSMTKSECQAVLKHHSQTLFPRKREGYTLYYRLIACEERVRVGILGVPSYLIDSYKELASLLGKRYFELNSYADHLGEMFFRQTKQERCILFYRENQMLHGSVVDHGLCLLLQKFPLEAIEASSKEWGAFLTTLMYYQSTEGRRSVCVLVENEADEQWIDTLREGMKEKFHQSITVHQKEVCQQEISNGKWYLLDEDYEENKGYLRESYKQKGLKLANRLLGCYIIGISLGLGYYGIEKVSLEKTLESEHYEAGKKVYAIHLNKQSEIAFCHEQLEANETKKHFFLEHLIGINQLEQSIPKLQWGVDLEEEKLYGVMTVDTLYESMTIIPLIESYFPEKVLTYQYEKPNRWASNQLSFVLSEGVGDESISQ